MTRRATFATVAVCVAIVAATVTRASRGQVGYVLFFAGPIAGATLIVDALDHGVGPRIVVDAWGRWNA